jgi:hypothetical protein
VGRSPRSGEFRSALQKACRHRAGRRIKSEPHFYRRLCPADQQSQVDPCSRECPAVPKLAGLLKASVANVPLIRSVDKDLLSKRVAKLSSSHPDLLLAGIKLTLPHSRHPAPARRFCSPTRARCARVVSASRCVAHCKLGDFDRADSRAALRGACGQVG